MKNSVFLKILYFTALSIPLFFAILWSGELRCLPPLLLPLITIFIIFACILEFLLLKARRKKKPKVSPAPELLIFVYFLFIYLFFIKVPEAHLYFSDCGGYHSNDYGCNRSDDKIRSYCHRLLLLRRDPSALYFLILVGDRNSVPFLIQNLPVTAGSDSNSLQALQGITNQFRITGRVEWLRWYMTNLHKSTKEWWADGFSQEGYAISKRGDRQTVHRLFLLLGKEKVPDKARLRANACKMLNMINASEVSRVEGEISASGDLMEKDGVREYEKLCFLFFLRAVENGDVRKVREFLRRDPRMAKGDYHMSLIPDKISFCSEEMILPDFRGVLSIRERGDSPLHRAYRPEIAGLLIENGADINRRDKEGYTPLFYYAPGNTRSEIKMAEFLITHGADVNARSNDGKTPLQKIWSCEIARLLIEKGADVNAKFKNGETPLYNAICRDHEEVIRFLVAHGARVNVKNNKGETPMHLVRSGEIADLLVKKGADVNARDNGGRTPLHRIASEELFDSFPDMMKYQVGKNHQIAEVLLKNGADINAIDNDDETPLKCAVLYGCKDIAELLRAHGACEEIPDIFGAAEKGDLEKMRVILEATPELVDAKGRFGQTPLGLAVEKGHFRLVELLLSKGADVNGKNGESSAPLRRAIVLGHTEIVRLLVSKGAKLNEEDQYGATPLHLAVAKENRKIVDFLLSNGADVNAAGKYHHTPLHEAIDWGHLDYAESLIAKGAEVNTRDCSQSTPLHSAVNKGSSEIVELLLKNGAEVNAKDDKGMSPLHDAALAGHKKIVELLLAAGAEVNAENENGLTPLYFSDWMHQKAVSDLLRLHGGKK